MRILVIRLSSIGDIVLTSPALRGLRRRFPDAKIDFLTKEEYGPWIRQNPNVNTVFFWEGSVADMAEEIKEWEYDCVIDLHGSLRTRWLECLLPESIPCYSYRKGTVGRLMSVIFKRNMYGGKHVVDRYMEALRPLGVEPDGQGLEFFIAKIDQVSAASLPFTHLAGFAVCCLGATHFTKKMPESKWAELLEKLPLPVILIGGKAEAAMGASLAARNEFKVLNFCGKLSPGQSADLIRQSKLVITHDTGMMHIAAAFQKKTISLWGGTVPWLGFKPYLHNEVNNIIIENKDLNCRPCSKYGTSTCSQGHFKCMNDLNLDAVIQAI